MSNAEKWSRMLVVPPGKISLGETEHRASRTNASARWQNNQSQTTILNFLSNKGSLYGGSARLLSTPSRCPGIFGNSRFEHASHLSFAVHYEPLKRRRFPSGTFFANGQKNFIFRKKILVY
jgi:hypothetical protein